MTACRAVITKFISKMVQRTINRAHDHFFEGVHKLEHCFTDNNIDENPSTLGQTTEKKRVMPMSLSERRQLVSELRLFDPKGVRIMIWDCICILAIFFTVFYVPVEIGFLSEEEPSAAGQVLHNIVDAIFFGDILVRRFTAIFESASPLFLPILLPHAFLSFLHLTSTALHSFSSSHHTHHTTTPTPTPTPSISRPYPYTLLTLLTLPPACLPAYTTDILQHRLRRPRRTTRYSPTGHRPPLPLLLAVGGPRRRSPLRCHRPGGRSQPQ